MYVHQAKKMAVMLSNPSARRALGKLETKKTYRVRIAVLTDSHTTIVSNRMEPI